MVTARKIDKDRHERTSAAARALMEAERLTRQAKTARLREQRLAATPATKTPSPAEPPPRATGPKPPPMKKRKMTDIS
ncbi:hypothetical protein LCM4577_07365 [Mesorhizobium sp. LCM 4577]|jgi:hypothetical protein|nr:hypothetical protein LCM4576_01145 [Mesorhizobium sp. LCM 4576]OHV70336.1 hypothetical protein LCM4577_07365 [Mesorhizobium sp. LCM 4577]CDX54173.1 hypothetical protein MPL3365_190057 [Mesorhizobium plurifarium]